jgi:hypothetical protein
MRGLIPLLIALGCTDARTMPNQSVGTTGVSTASTSGGTTATGGTGTSGGTTGSPSGMSCTPFSSWCENDMLLNCTRSGMDATGYDCTKLNSTMYSYHCVSQCPNQASNFGPCCSYTAAPGTTGGTTGGPAPKIPCSVALTLPASVNQDSTNFPSGMYCSPPSKPDCPGYGTLDVSFVNEPKTCPPTSTGYSFNVSIYRASITVGQPISFPSQVAFVNYTDAANSQNNCSGWSGTMTLVSDAPIWKLTFDLTCFSNTAVKLKGTLSGDVS